MKAVILAAGKSTRTYPLTRDIPKPLLKIANKNLLFHLLDNINSLVEEVIIIVSYKKDQIIETIGNNYKQLNIKYVYQKEALGTGHALFCAKKFLEKEDFFLLLNGDDLLHEKDIKKLIKNKPGILLYNVEKPPKNYIDIDPKNYGCCKINDVFLERINEKDVNNLSCNINTGAYVLPKEIFELDSEKSERGEYELPSLINNLINEKKIKFNAVFVEEYWLPIGYPWDMLRANKIILKRIFENKKEAIIGKNTEILEGVILEGEVIIGDDCKIGPNCYIRGPTSIGDNCRIGQAVEIKASIIMNNTKIPHLSYIGDSIISYNCNLGAGTIVANLRHDNKNVKSMSKGKLIDTGLRKFGCVVANGCKLGINTMIYPGRKIWPNKTTFPGEIVKKDIM